MSNLGLLVLDFACILTKVNELPIGMMNPLKATNNHWQQLNELEAAYERGEVSMEEVDAKVERLITDLNQEHREVLSLIFNGLASVWHEQKDTIIGAGLLGVATYAWLVLHQLA